MSEPVKVDKTFQIVASRLWKILTDESEMKKWYFDIPGFRAEEGYEFRFYGGPEERRYLHICQILEVIPEHKLSYSWRYDGFNGMSVVTFELEEENGNTKLCLTHEGIETFPQDNLDFNKVNFESGWTQIIQGSLSEYIEKNSVISMG